MAYKFWTGGFYGDWKKDSNWSSGNAPQSGDFSVVNEGHLTAKDIGLVDQLVWLNASIKTDKMSGLSLHLDGSSLGPTTSVILNGDLNPITITGHNSWFQGHIFLGSGGAGIDIDADTCAINYGWIGVASSQPYTTLGLGSWSGGDFANFGGIQAGVNGTFHLYLGQIGVPESVGNWGTVRADPGGTVMINGALQPDGTANGTFVNFNRVDAAGGHVRIEANLLQSVDGRVVIDQGGSAYISGKTDGGTIEIKQGMLDLGDKVEFGPGVINRNNFHSEIEFTGATGAIAVGNDNIRVAFDEAANTLALMTPWKGGETAAAWFDMGENRDYSASDFRVEGDMVIYTQPGSVV